jgi:dienelactone hydrolase
MPSGSDLQRAEINFNFRNNSYKGFVVAPSVEQCPRPLILILHNFQGLKFFEIDVAEYLARLGYVGIAADLYGDAVPPDQRLWPEEENLVKPFMKKCFEGLVSLDHDHEKFRALLKTWLKKGLESPFVDRTIAPAAIGYCFGGMAVLECIRGGLNVGGVVSFHGLLQTGEDPNAAKNGAIRPPLKFCQNNYNTKAVVLIENGADDYLVTGESKKRFYAEMNEARVDWNFHDHAGTPHGFALPTSLGPPGHLHENSDRRSTMNMLNLFKEIFPGVVQNQVDRNAAGTLIPN